MQKFYVCLLSTTLALAGCRPSADQEPPEKAGAGEMGAAKESPDRGSENAKPAPSLSEAVKARVEPRAARLNPLVPQGKRGDSVTKPDTRRLPSKLQYAVLQEGSGEPPPLGSSVSVHITGWQRIGNILGPQFWNSRDDGKPHEYRLNKDSLIEGLVEMIRQMRRGERRWIVVPSDLGYRDVGYGNLVPAGADLVFDIELADFSAPRGN